MPYQYRVIKLSEVDDEVIRHKKTWQMDSETDASQVVDQTPLFFHYIKTRDIWSGVSAT